MLKKYFEGLCDIETQEQVVIQRGNYSGGEPIGRVEVEVRMGKLKNGKAISKDEITVEQS